MYIGTLIKEKYYNIQADPGNVTLPCKLIVRVLMDILVVKQNITKLLYIMYYEWICGLEYWYMTDRGIEHIQCICIFIGV